MGQARAGDAIGVCSLAGLGLVEVYLSRRARSARPWHLGRIYNQCVESSPMAHDTVHEGVRPRPPVNCSDIVGDVNQRVRYCVCV